MEPAYSRFGQQMTTIFIKYRMLQLIMIIIIIVMIIIIK